jgi:hypothetical protein
MNASFKANLIKKNGKKHYVEEVEVEVDRFGNRFVVIVFVGSDWTFGTDQVDREHDRIHVVVLGST